MAFFKLKIVGAGKVAKFEEKVNEAVNDCYNNHCIPKIEYKAIRVDNMDAKIWYHAFIEWHTLEDD